MECVLLGTGGMMPMPGRPLTSVAVRTGGAVYLLDCGEGAQVPYKSTHCGVRPLRMVAISHLHADHCLGLPGLLMLRSQMETPEPLMLVGPVGLRRFVQNVIRDLACRITFEIRYTEIDPAAPVPPKGPGSVVYRDDLISLWYLPLHHSVFCAGYRIEEHERPGRFALEAARALGIPSGPLYGKLQAGEAVTLDDGRVITPEQVLGPSRRGRHVAFATDTAPCKNLYRVLEQADIAFVEGMFLPEHEEEAKAKRHLTVVDAARIAGRAEAREAILVHLSPRYEPGQVSRVEQVARGVNERCRPGRDHERFEIALPD
jgi:ribonuclease Z